MAPSTARLLGVTRTIGPYFLCILATSRDMDPDTQDFHVHGALDRAKSLGPGYFERGWK